jgi:hypothetical protein
MKVPSIEVVFNLSILSRGCRENQVFEGVFHGGYLQLRFYSIEVVFNFSSILVRFLEPKFKI